MAISDLESLIPPLLELLHQVSTAVLEVYRESRQLNVITKADHSPLTQGDLIAHEILTTGLAKIAPGIPILSEEGDIPSYAERRSWTYYWLIDPIDGTREFIKHSGEFSINVALIHQDQPILGMLYVPVIQECYGAIKGKGAFKMTADNHKMSIQVRPWDKQHTLILVSHAAKTEIIARRFAALPYYEYKNIGSAWKYGLIAEGKADIYLRVGQTCEWDTAAGQCILEEAGGAVLTLDQASLRYNQQELLVNPPFIALGNYQPLLAALNFADFK